MINITETNLLHISYTEPHYNIENSIIPILYNNNRFVVKIPTSELITIDNNSITIKSYTLSNYINELERKILADIKLYWKTWGFPKKSKYISLVNENEYSECVTIEFNGIQPAIYDENKSIININSIDTGNIKMLLEFKSIILNKIDSNLKLETIVHQMQLFKKKDTFNQITDFALSDLTSS